MQSISEFVVKKEPLRSVLYNKNICSAVYLFANPGTALVLFQSGAKK